MSHRQGSPALARVELRKMKKHALLYRIGLPSKTTTPLALFVELGLVCYCSCIRQQTRVATNTAIAAQIMTNVFSVRGDNGLAVRLSGNTRSCDR